MPALDVFINVFSSSFHRLFYSQPHCFGCERRGDFLFAPAEVQKRKGTVVNSCTKKKTGERKRVICRFRPGLASSNFPREGKGDCGMFYARRNQKYSNIPPVSGGMTTILQKRCIFQDGIISPPTLLPPQSKSGGGIKFLTLSVFCNKVGCGKKVSRHPLKTCRSHFNAEIGASGLSSEVTTSGSHDGRQTLARSAR